ncbi:MAG: hypothetical protein JW827_04685 [Spirochaetes bacterium]|nr:hypothetical protein [Spirochaetota bacterium]
MVEISGQLTFDDSPLILKFNTAVDYIRNGEFNKALENMEDILNTSPDFPGLLEGIKSVKFWQNRWLKVMRTQPGKEQSDLLLDEWAQYEKYWNSFPSHSEKILITIKNLIYKKIIKNLIAAFKNSEVPNVTILIKMGMIFLEIDEYIKAIETLEYARMFKKKDSHILGLLAEAYARQGNIQKAKSLFREAFLYNPLEVDLGVIRSEMITDITKQIQEQKVDPKLLGEWIPVYGTVMNVFNIKRELSIEEINKLATEAEEMEKDFYNEKFNHETILPKLINRYLWIIDYYVFQSPNKEYTRIYMNKLKEVHPQIYERYFSLINLKN